MVKYMYNIDGKIRGGGSFRHVLEKKHISATVCEHGKNVYNIDGKKWGGSSVIH